jgi:hypothetical protein
MDQANQNPTNPPAPEPILDNSSPFSPPQTPPPSSPPPEPPPNTSNTVIAPDPSSPTPHSSPNPKGSRKAVIAIIASLLILTTGIITGVILLRKPSFTIPKAWDCSQYTFNVSQLGEVTVINSSADNTLLQSAEVYIDSVLVETFDVPALISGNSATLGTVSVPGEQFQWEVIGTEDCENSGSYEPAPTPTPETTTQCEAVKIFNTSWEEIDSQDLPNLKPGDTVYLSVTGIAASGNFDKAQFTVNGTQRPEVSTKQEGTDRYYDEYTLPSGISSFNISAKIHHAQLDQWF